MLDQASPLVISGNRWKALKTGLLMLLFGAISACGLLTDQKRVLFIFGTLCCGLAALQSLVGVILPSKLIVDDHGLHWRGLRSWRVMWSEVERFRLISLRRSTLVAIDYRDAQVRPGAWVRLRRPKAVPGTLSRPPEDIHALLQGRLDAVQAADPAQRSAMTESRTILVPQPTFVFPWLSVGLILVLCLVFAAEIAWPLTAAGHGLQPSVMTLAGFGGLSRMLAVGDGQWYRFITAPFLHGSLAHLLSNCVGLFLAGRLLEGLVGRAWFAATYVVGGLTGGIGSILLNSSNVVGVGASGAIVALFAAAFVCSLHFPRSVARDRLQTRAFVILIPTLLTLGKTGDGLVIDVGAHIGGAIGGALVGLAVLKGWGIGNARPPRRKVGLAITVLGCTAMAASAWPATSGYRRFERLAALVPAESMPTDPAQVLAKAPGLLARYPGDPRLRLAMAYRDLQNNDAVAAEREAREGLRDPLLLREALIPRVQGSLWLVLGQALANQKKDGPALHAFDQATATDGTLAEVDYRRAMLLFGEGSLDPALRAAKAYVQRSPKAADGWNLVGDLLFAQTDPSAAVIAYDTSDHLRSSQLAVRARGLAKVYAGDAQGALVDLQQATAMDPKDLYAALWLDIAGERQGRQSSLSVQTTAGQDQDWPAPVVRLLLGMISPADLMSAARAGTPNPDGYVCEAGVYTGEWHLIHRRQADAEAAFRQASVECPPTFVETWMARAELKQDVPPNR